MQLLWEETDLIWLDNRDVGMATIVWHLDEWLPHENPLWLAARYRKATKNRLAQLKENLDLKPKGIRDITAKTIQEIETLLQDDNRPLDFKADQKAYHDVMTLTAAFDNVHAVESTQLAVQDQINTFKEEYAEKGRAFLTKLAEEEAKAIALLKKAVNEKHGALAEITAYGIEFAKSAQDILLQNPLLQDQKLIFIKGGFWFSSNWGGPNSLGNEFVTLSPVRPDGNIETLFKTNKITDYDLDWDAKKLIYGNGRHIIESSLDGKTQRQITTVENQHVMHFDACYLPSGQVVFSSTACEQARPLYGRMVRRKPPYRRCGRKKRETTLLRPGPQLEPDRPQQRTRALLALGIRRYAPLLHATPLPHESRRGPDKWSTMAPIPTGPTPCSGLAQSRDTPRRYRPSSPDTTGLHGKAN
jgi:hypothetical protein